MAVKGRRVEARAQFTVLLAGAERRATPGVVFDCPDGELAALLSTGNVVRSDKDPTPFEDWPEPPDTFSVTEVFATKGPTGSPEVARGMRKHDGRPPEGDAP